MLLVTKLTLKLTTHYSFCIKEVVSGLFTVSSFPELGGVVERSADI